MLCNVTYSAENLFIRKSFEAKEDRGFVICSKPGLLQLTLYVKNVILKVRREYIIIIKKRWGYKMFNIFKQFIEDNLDVYLTGSVVFLVFCIVLNHKYKIFSVVSVGVLTTFLCGISLLLFLTVQSEYFAFINYIVTCFCFFITIKLVMQYSPNKIWWSNNDVLLGQDE